MVLRYVRRRSVRPSHLFRPVHILTVSWMPPRRSFRLHSCWLIIIDLSDSASKIYHLVNQCEDGDSTLESIYPDCIIQPIPPFMTNVLAALKNYCIHCSHCADTLLRCIGDLVKNSSYNCICESLAPSSLLSTIALKQFAVDTFTKRSNMVKIE